MRYIVASFALVIVALGMPFALGQEITMSSEQGEYYFLVGQEVFFQIELDNTYGEPISGTLISNIEQVDPATGTNISRANNNQFTLSTGVSYVDVNLGVHNAPTSLTVDLLLSYIQDKAKLVDLDPIVVNIVQTPQEQQESEPIEATSQDADTQPQQNQQQPPPQQQPGGTQDRLQNNQVAQDSTALREDIRSQIAQDAESMRDILEAARADPEFQRLNEELESQGYEMRTQFADPDGESDGTFDFEYANAQNERANISGSVENMQVTEISSQTQQEFDGALEALLQNPEFQELKEMLESDGYEQTNQNAAKLEDGTLEAMVNFEDEEGSPAQIRASIINGTATDVRLVQDKDDPDYIVYGIVAAIAAAAVATYIVYHYRKKKPVLEIKTPAPKPKPARDYWRECQELLDKASDSFNAGMQKLGYGLVGQALRLGLAHAEGVDAQRSNTELLALLDESSSVYEDLADCLDTSALVVFAKRNADKDDFERILGSARRILEAHYA